MEGLPGRREDGKNAGRKKYLQGKEKYLLFRRNIQKNSPKSSRLSAFPATNFTLLQSSFGNCEENRLFSC